MGCLAGALGAEERLEGVGDEGGAKQAEREEEEGNCEREDAATMREGRCPLFRWIRLRHGLEYLSGERPERNAIVTASRALASTRLALT